MGRRRRRALDGRLAIRRREDRDARGRCDRGYFSSLEILACHEAGITVTLPKPQTSGAKSDGRFGKQDFVYCQRRWEQLPYRFTSGEDGKRLRRYWTTACQDCSLKSQCRTGPERRMR
jgi:hypothetical protein